MALSRSHHRILAWLQPSTLAALAALTGVSWTESANAQVPQPLPPGRATARPVAPFGGQAEPAMSGVERKNAMAKAPNAAAPPAPFDADEERAATLAEHANFNGSIGLLRTAYAGSGAPGTFRVGFLADLFSSSGFLCNKGTPCEPTSADDSASHVGGWFTVNATPLPFLEAYAGIRTYANSDTLGVPTLLQVLGDTTLGLKVFTPARIGNVLTVGGDFRLLLLNGAGDVGVAGSGTSAELNLLTSLDFRKLQGRGVGVPVRLHVNVGYKIDNSGKLVEGVETVRAERNPALSGGLERIPVSRIERFGLGINRVDFIPLRFGVDAPLRWVQPYAEFSVDVPFNRQGYACHTRTISEGDVCLALSDLTNPQSGAPGLAAAPSRVSLGARLNPLNDAFRGLSGHVAVDIGTTGTTKFVEEVAPQAPWTLYLGLGYAFDTQNTQKKAPPAPLPVAAPPAPPEMIPPPAEYFVRGTVKEKGATTLVARAFVTLRDPGANDPPYATDGSGSFLTRRLEPGSHSFEISAEGYKTATCIGNIAAALPTAAAVPVAAVPVAVASPGNPTVGAQGGPPAPTNAPAPKQHVTGSFFTDLSCELESLPKMGGVIGTVTTSEGGALAGATIVLTDAKGATKTTTSGADGSFKFAELTPGEVKLRVDADKHFGHSQDAAIRPREDVKATVALSKRPAQSSVKVTGEQIQISKQIHFESDSAVILGDSTQLLEEIADVINKNEKLKNIEIQGHTDNTGTPQRNKELSQGRADAVRTWLLDKGAVAAERISAKGFGQERPLVPNVTPANRARNRRVQFILLKK